MPSIKKVGRGYVVRARDWQGKDRRYLVPNRTLAEELAASIVDVRIRANHGLVIPQQRMTFKRAWEEWLNRYKAGTCSRVKPQASTVRAVFERRAALASLDNLYLDEIDQARLERVGVQLVNGGHAALASRAVGLAKRVIRDAQDRDVRVNPSVFRVSFPVPVPREARAFTWDEVLLLASFVPERLRRGVLLLALTGLRVSEFCALTDADVFLKSGSDHAPLVAGAVKSEAALRPDGRGVVGSEMATPAGASYILVRRSKTQAGIRRVYLTDHAALLVREQMLARPNVGREELGSATGVRTPAYQSRAASRVLFPNEHGQPYDRHEIYGFIHRAGQHSGLGRVRPHELRHTHVSLCASSGVPFDVVRAQLGWSERTAALMWAKYRRLFEGEAVLMVQRLDSLVNPGVREAAVG